MRGYDGPGLRMATGAVVPPPAKLIPPPPQPAGGWPARITRARALRDYADRHHHFGEGAGPTWAGSEPVDAWAACACGASWSDDEGGCSERVQLLADAERIERGEAL